MAYNATPNQPNYATSQYPYNATPMPGPQWNSSQLRATNYEAGHVIGETDSTPSYVQETELSGGQSIQPARQGTPPQLDQQLKGQPLR